MAERRGVADQMGPRGRDDLVLTLAFETWPDTVRRASFSPDVLAEFVVRSPRVDRLLVADPWRSVLSPVKRRLAAAARRAAAEPDFPSSATRSHVAPLRLRRDDPLDPQQAMAAHRRYLRRVARAASSAGLRRPALVATHPFTAAAADPAEWGAVTYYGWDDWAAHPAFEASWPAYREAYGLIAAHGHAVIGVTQRVVEAVGSPGPSLVLPNGIVAGEWEQPVAPPDWFTQLPGPRLLYAGTVDSRLDVGLVLDVAAAFPQASVVVVGTIADESAAAAVRVAPNVHVRSWQPRPVLRGLTCAADVALIPHVDSDLTRAMSPLKLYEYLAAGRPVVATDLPPIRTVPGVLVAEDRAEFTALVAAAIARGPASEDERLAFVAANAWPSRFERLLDVALRPGALRAPAR